MSPKYLNLYRYGVRNIVKPEKKIENYEKFRKEKNIN